MYRIPRVLLVLLMLGAMGCESSDDNGGEPINLSQVTWLHTDVSGWTKTATLNASVSGSSMIMDYDKARVWPSTDGSVANAWIFVQIDGQWYAGTWEWMTPGQTVKEKSAVSGSHIKVGALKNFSPRSGETYGFMVSGLARDGRRSALERSNVDMVVWP